MPGDNRWSSTVLGSLCPECREHFEAVKEYLDEAGIRYLIDDRLRGVGLLPRPL